MRTTTLLGAGAITGTALIGFALPALAAGTSPGPSGSVSASPTVSASGGSPTRSASPSPIPTSDAPRSYRINVTFDPPSTRPGGTVNVVLDPACSGSIVSDAFAAPGGAVDMPHHDAPFLVTVRGDAAPGAYGVVVACESHLQGSGGRGTLIVVGQTTKTPVGGAETGGGGSVR